MFTFDSSKVTKSFNFSEEYFNTSISTQACTCTAMETGTIFTCFKDL